jgi:hypothetical protein
MQPLPEIPASLRSLVRRRLFAQPPDGFRFNIDGDLRRISSVLFLMGQDPRSGKPMVIFNKRSQQVRQPGDLCCPGGGIAPASDAMLALLLRLPASPLSRWPLRHWWRGHRPHDFARLALLLAAGLREGFEEMRLNPFGITFLGPMPVQHLVLFKRSIYPLVVWIDRQRRFKPNWEVERIVSIPLADFFDPKRYARYRISFNPPANGAPPPADREMACFIHHHNNDEELLWGATFRITMQFLKIVAGFVPPPPISLPVIHRTLGGRYLAGSLLEANGRGSG